MLTLSVFLHQIWRNVALHHLLSNGSSAVNGCHQNDPHHSSPSVNILRQNKQIHHFHSRKCYYGLWTRIWVKNVLMMDLFLTNICLLKTLTDGLVWIIVTFLSAVWTLILTAPIHCRASIAETLMQCYISPNLMKKQTHPHLGWPEGEDIYCKLFLFFLVN